MSTRSVYAARLDYGQYCSQTMLRPVCQKLWSWLTRGGRVRVLHINAPPGWREISPDSPTALFNLMILGAVRGAPQPPPAEIVITAADVLRCCTALADGPPLTLDAAEVWRRVRARCEELGEAEQLLCGLPEGRGAVEVRVRLDPDDRFMLGVKPAPRPAHAAWG